MSVGRLHGGTHAPERLGDALHRARGERRVADELDASLLPREQPGDEAHERPRVAAVDGRIARPEPVEADATHPQRVGALVDDVDAERAHRGDRRLGVRRAPEARHERLALADRAEQHRAVRDRLVARHCDVTFEGGNGLDAHGERV